LYPIPAAGVFDRAVERGRLALLRHGCQLGTLVARIEQGD